MSSFKPKAVGPSFYEISNHYKGKEGVYAQLSEKIMGGTKGKWGQAEMPANPAVSLVEANAIVDYILNSTNSTEDKPACHEVVL